MTQQLRQLSRHRSALNPRATLRICAGYEMKSAVEVSAANTAVFYHADSSTSPVPPAFPLPNDIFPHKRMIKPKWTRAHMNTDILYALKVLNKRTHDRHILEDARKTEHNISDRPSVTSYHDP